MLAKIVARKVVKPILAWFLNVTCKQSEKMKYVAKKSSCIYPFFFLLKAKSFVAQKKKYMKQILSNQAAFRKVFLLLRVEWSSNQLFFDSSFQHFFLKINLAFSRKFLQQRLSTKRRIFFAVRRKGRLFLQQKFKKKIDKVFHKTARLLYCHHCKIFFESAATVSTKACKTNFAFAYNFFWDFKQLMN